MTWIKLDDTFPDHRKVLGLTPEAGWLWICGLCYCSRNRSDGVLPKAGLERLCAVADVHACASELLAAGLWKDSGEAYEFIGYLDHQRSKAEIESMIEKRRAAGKKSAASRANKQSVEQSVEQDAQQGVEQKFNTSDSASDSASENQKGNVIETAFDLVAQHRLATATGVQNADAYVRSVKAKLKLEHFKSAGAMLDKNPEWTASRLARELDGGVGAYTEGDRRFLPGTGWIQ